MVGCCDLKSPGATYETLLKYSLKWVSATADTGAETISLPLPLVALPLVEATATDGAALGIGFGGPAD